MFCICILKADFYLINSKAINHINKDICLNLFVNLVIDISEKQKLLCWLSTENNEYKQNGAQQKAHKWKILWKRSILDTTEQ